MSTTTPNPTLNPQDPLSPPHSAPSTQAKRSLRPFFDQLHHTSTALDDMLTELDLSKEETEMLINSSKYHTHRKLRAQLIQQQLQITAQNHAQAAMQTLLNLTDSNHAAIARLAATQILSLAGIHAQIPPTHLLHQSTKSPSPPPPSPPIPSAGDPPSGKPAVFSREANPHAPAHGAHTPIADHTEISTPNPAPFQSPAAASAAQLQTAQPTEPAAPAPLKNQKSKIKNETPALSLRRAAASCLAFFLTAFAAQSPPVLPAVAILPHSRENSVGENGGTMPRELLLALDQGTTSSRAILFDSTGRQIAAAQKELRQIYPKPGWVEHDPEDIWQTQIGTAREVLASAKISACDIAAVGITNQRETTLLWDRATGQPLFNAIVWQDRRTADFCHSLKSKRAALIQQKTGLIPDAYFSASKLRWLLENIPGARELAAKGELAFGTVDSWLLYRLTGGADGGVHATDVSNASRTMLFDIHTGAWDEELLALFDIPRELLPEVRPSAGLFGETHLLDPASAAIPIAGIAGDQQAALFGQNCLSPGLAKNTYGTGCFLLMNCGETAPLSKHQLLTTIAWQIPSEKSKSENQKSKMVYALEGSVFVGGAVVQWLRDGLGIIQSASEIEALAASVPDSGGVYIVPAFAGLGAPHWDQYARGTIAGLTRGTHRGHIARAALESIAFQVADLLDVMRADAAGAGGAGGAIRELRVDGGAARNNLLLQFQADLLRVPVLRPGITETTALGAALLAGLGAGVIGSASDLAALWKAEAEFLPVMSGDEAAYRRKRWNVALDRSREWEEPAT